MNDTNTTIQDLKTAMAEFVAERDWNQFHSPKNLSMDIVREATELMEKFLWMENQESVEVAQQLKEEVEHELADVLKALLAFANVCDIDVVQAFSTKLALTKAKYPVDKSRGRYTKYNRL